MRAAFTCGKIQLQYEVAVFTIATIRNLSGNQPVHDAQFG
jgi:hypothetical protein